MQRTTADVKLAGIALKRPKMPRKHHKFRQGDRYKNSDVFLLLFLTPWQRSLKSPYRPLSYFCYATTILTRELGVYLWSLLVLFQRQSTSSFSIDGFLLLMVEHLSNSEIMRTIFPRKIHSFQFRDWQPKLSELIRYSQLALQFKQCTFIEDDNVDHCHLHIADSNELLHLISLLPQALPHPLRTNVILRG